MKYILSLLFTFFGSFLLFSQVITFECNNEIITVSFDQIANNPNAYMDWNGDGQINEEDYLIYLSQVYGCDEVDCNGEEQDCNEEEEGCYDDFGTFYEIADGFNYNDCEGVICESPNNWVSFIVPGCEGNSQEWEEIEWVVFGWDDFDWESVWVDFDLGNIVDWDNIPWDDIIDINILPEDLIEYIISISGAQPFNWGNFVLSESEGCVDNDDTVSIGLSIWTDVDGCADALLYIESLGLDCSTPLNLIFVSADPIPLSEICCQTCQNSLQVMIVVLIQHG